MKIPVVRGVIDRRILVNYRVDPGVLAPLLPAPFRPKVVHGVGMVGICLIRLKRARPVPLPAWIGVSSENAAHRAAVEWDDGRAIRDGVYIRRRETSSWLNALAGDRLFPGMHNHARFTVEETSDRYSVALQSDDGVTRLRVRGRRAEELPATSVFRSLQEASAFFEAGSLGYSATRDPSRFQGLELRCLDWQLEPLGVEEVRSSFFEDESLFPRGSIEFDCALLMRGIAHEWHAKPDLCQEASDMRSECPMEPVAARRTREQGAIECPAAAAGSPTVPSLNPNRHTIRNGRVLRRPGARALLESSMRLQLVPPGRSSSSRCSRSRPALAGIHFEPDLLVGQKESQ